MPHPPSRSSLRKTIYSTYRSQEPLRRLFYALSPIEFLKFLRLINRHTLREVVRSTLQQRLPSLASEMAYNAMLGLFPAILALLTAIGLFAPLQKTFNHLAFRLSEIAPQEVLMLIQDFASEISESQNRGLFSLSFLISLLASSGAMSAAMRALDQIHCIPLSQRRPFWQARLVSVGLTVGTILLLMIASSLVFVSDWGVRLLASQSGEAIGQWVLTIWRLFSWPLALGIVSAAFAFVYRFGPSRWVRGRPLVPGAVLAALSWALISALFRLYVSHFGNYNRVYGAVGTVIILLLWLFLTSLVMLIGNQLNVTVGQAMAARSQRHRSARLAQPTLHQNRWP
ncbi:MAG: YihY/virulence factor BrkB family protein [Leptolyngbya sp. SIO4C1]|nr:YihY/virulence factor BrkB family protein [Leptolyngbya sp. SIO4C1]